MAIPRKQRQWEIYRANMGESSDFQVLVLSSDESNEIMGSQVVACEVFPQKIKSFPPSPVTIPATPEDTGLEEEATIAVATLASIPCNCLVALEGRLQPVALRMAVDKGLQILLGNESWP